MKQASMRRAFALALAALLSVASSGAGAAPVQISFQAQDLADTVPGQDRWLYQYFVQGSFSQFSGFTLLFPPSEYPAFDGVPVAPDPAWDVFSLPPDPALALEGIVSATALVDNPPLNQPFEATVIWAGAGAPGAQSFEVFDSSFQVVQQGITVAVNGNPVPEPGSLLLALGGMGLLLTRRRRQ